MRISVRRIRRATAAGGIHLLYGLLRCFPRGVARKFCRFLGRLAWLLDVSGRKNALANLELAFGNELLLSERIALGRSSYIHLASNLADLSRLSRLNTEQLSSLVTGGEETVANLENILIEGRGILLITPHLGNWELLTAYLASRGLKVHFVGRKPYDERLDSLVAAVRTSHGSSWISRGGAFEQLQEVLGKGEVAILLIDQDTGRVKGTFVDFFGIPAWTPTGPAVLERMTGAVIVPGAMVHGKDNKYRIHLESPLSTVCTGNEEYDDWENTRRASFALESLIRQYPDQWTWFHRRWKTRPPQDWVTPTKSVDINRSEHADSREE